MIVNKRAALYHISVDAWYDQYLHNRFNMTPKDLFFLSYTSIELEVFSNGFQIESIQLLPLI